jgi:membrane-associated protease RseP (regulator of RpoE activity)
LAAIYHKTKVVKVMAIISAILIHFLGHKIPLWFTRQKMKCVRVKGGWQQIYFEMSGALFDFLVAFLILTLVGLMTKDIYLLNENIIYGLNFNQNAQKLGFENGDKILAVNDKLIVEYDDILENITASKGEVRISIKREDYDTVIVFSDKDKLDLIGDGTSPFIPRLNADTVFNSQIDLIFSERQRSLSKSLAYFPDAIGGISGLFAPQPGIVYSIPVKVTDLRSFLHWLGWILIMLGFLNLLPIPGLDFGNSLIAIIETKRKIKFNPRRIRIVRYCCVGIVSILLVIFFLY